MVRVAGFQPAKGAAKMAATQAIAKAFGLDADIHSARSELQVIQSELVPLIHCGWSMGGKRPAIAKALRGS